MISKAIKPTEAQERDGDRFRLGFTCAKRVRLVEVVSGRFYIFHHQGHSEYCGSGQGYRYCEGFHAVIDSQHKNQQLHNVFFGNIAKVRGKYTNKDRQTLLDAIAMWVKQKAE